MKKVRVYSVILIAQLGQYLVTLEEVDGIRLIPIWMGPAEGGAIAAHLNKQKFPRPITHDLMINIFKELGATIDKVTITDLKESTFYATMTLCVNSKKINIDSRPSDGIALAVRVNAPIFMDKIIFDKCPLIKKPITSSEVKNFKKELENLTPNDFFKKT